MTIRRIDKDDLILDKYGRTCVDCGKPLYLRYSGPLRESQMLCKLSDAATDWMDQYTGSGDSFDEDVKKSKDNDELFEFLSLIQKFDSLDVRQIPKSLMGVYEDAKRRGFFVSIGADDKAGEYVMICPNRQCARKREGISSTYPQHPDQRGKHININEDGTQDEYEKVFVPKETKMGEKTCPGCGDITMFKDHVDPDTGEDVYNCSRCGNDYITNGKGGFKRFYF